MVLWTKEFADTEPVDVPLIALLQREFGEAERSKRILQQLHTVRALPGFILVSSYRELVTSPLCTQSSIRFNCTPITPKTTPIPIAPVLTQHHVHTHTAQPYRSTSTAQILTSTATRHTFLSHPKRHRQQTRPSSTTTL